MKLSIIIPTYNRAASLERTLASLLAARVPNDLEFTVAVVDNNSTDDTKAIVERNIPLFGRTKLEYFFEPRQGKSFAYNTGVMRSDGDLVAGIDDDIEIATDWFEGVSQLFTERWEEIDFAGGKILPKWEVEPPGWIGPLKDGVIGWREYGDEEWRYTLETPILAGGHAVFKRTVFDRVGLLPESVGTTGKKLIGCEDLVFFHMLMNEGLRGIYFPRLKVYHYVPAYRLSKSYYRQWCFGAGVSRHLMDVYYRRIEGSRLFDVPGWMYRQFLSGIFGKMMAVFGGTEEESLEKDNPILVFAGFFYAKHIRESRIDQPLTRLVSSLVRTAQR